MKQLECVKNSSSTVLFPSYNINLRTVDGQPICNRCKKVDHEEKVCTQSSYNKPQLPIIEQHVKHKRESFL